ncbi:hypothetical protein BRC62_07760 [Halobacteriales archaeon QH_10_67_13]|nr:MAG: hypothetical protein BRC62_07760 [Halobacteriales archaeon QH_10_67_13]
MSTPLVTVRLDRTVRAATARMDETRLKRSVVTDGLDPVEIRTATDLVTTHPELNSEIPTQLNCEVEHSEAG